MAAATRNQQAQNVRAVSFDGANDYLTRGAGYTGAADSKKGTVSFWIKLNSSGNGVRQKILGCSDNDAYIERQSDNTFRLRMEATSGGASVDAETSGTYTDADGWLNLLASWDAELSLCHLYINDTDDLAASPSFNNTNIDYTHAEETVGALDGGGRELDADLAEVYFNIAEYIDLSVESNRRKFITTEGKPSNLGSDGSTPTGTAPILYLSLAAAAAVNTFATNKGAGGGMSITGTLTEASTSPSD